MGKPEKEYTHNGGDEPDGGRGMGCILGHFGMSKTAFAKGSSTSSSSTSLRA